jgi:hypothetical protein
MDDVNPIFFDVADQPAKLFEEIAIVKAGQRILANLPNPELFCLSLKRATVLQASEMDLHFPALVQLPQQLQSLAFAAALLETVDDEENLRFHFTSSRAAACEGFFRQKRWLII